MSALYEYFLVGKDPICGRFLLLSSSKLVVLPDRANEGEGNEKRGPR